MFFVLVFPIISGRLQMKRVSVYYQELSKFAVARAEGKVVFDFPPLFPDVCQEQ